METPSEQWSQEINSPFSDGPAQLSWETIELPYKSGLYSVKRYYYHDPVTGDTFQSPEQFDALVHQLRLAHATTV